MPERPSLLADLAIAGRGLLMGAADIVPGVSGGTVALLMGIYSRLLTAISHFDTQLLGHLRAGQWKQAAGHIDLRFLTALAIGVLSGFVLLADLLHYLLEHHVELTMAVFFGLILASSILVLRTVQPKDSRQRLVCWSMSIVGAGLAAWLVLGGYLTPQDNLPYVFGCGAIAICAMILPGISGSYILVLLGKYEDMLGIIHHAKALEATSEELLTLAVFASGCLVGLLVFSKVLKAILSWQYHPTMALLGGFMIGSLAKTWPWQVHVAGAPEKVTKPYWPEMWNEQVSNCLLLAIVAFAVVLALDFTANWISHRRQESRA